MRRAFFKLLARLNRLVLPKLRPEHLVRMNGPRKALLGWRYWVTCQALG